MFWLRGCPRCRGDLYLEQNELDDEEVFCIQCGFRRFGMPVALTRHIETQDEPVVARAA